MRRFGAFVAAAVLSLCAAVSLAGSGGWTARAAAPGDVFAATAAASGVRMTMVVPNAPATDTPIDGGGPTAQASLSSLGESIGYAAFPDPGGTVISAPGLVAGFSQAPVSPPEYPLFVRSDATTRPDVAADAGAYALRATSDPASSRATASGGLKSESGTLGSVSSSATTTSADGRLVSTGVTEARGLAVGPLTIGQIRSLAQLVQDRDGSRTPTSSLELSGVRVGDTPIEITADGLNVADGATVPLPVGATAAELLKAQQITVDVLGVSADPGTVVSPALRIRFPSQLPDGGTAVVTMVIGNSVATLTSTLGVPIGGVGFTPGGVAPTSDGIAGAAALPALEGAAVPGYGAIADVAPVSADQTRSGLRIPPQPSIDVGGLYVVCALALLALFALSRLVGVRARWRS